MHGRSGAVRVETDRLLLRLHEPADFDALSRRVADPGMFRYSHRGAMTGEEAWSLLLRHVGHWNALGFGIFAIVDKGSGALIGEAGLSDFRRGLGNNFDPYPEITWSILPALQGQGYATEAAAAALRWLERERGARRTVCLIHDRNAASFAVAAKLGYAPYANLDYRGYPATLLSRVA